jgi:hypothetical protein
LYEWEYIQVQSFTFLPISLISKINLGFNWGDLGLVRMGIRTSPSFTTEKINKINLGFNWGDLGLVRMGIRTSPSFTTEKINKIIWVLIGVI